MTLRNLNLKNRFPLFDSKIYYLLGLAICCRLPGIDAVLASDELAMVSLWSQMPYEKFFQWDTDHKIKFVDTFLVAIKKSSLMLRIA